MISGKIKEYIFTTCILILILILIFFGTDHYMASQVPKGKHFWMPALPWDDKIPLLSGWIWIYLLYFPLCFLPITWKEIWGNIIFFQKTVWGYAIISLAANFIFWIFPSRILRPSVPSFDLTGQLMLLTYTVDPGFNVFPSLHVALIAYVACLAWRASKKSLSMLIWIFCFLVALSTLFVRQHYILDLPAGFLLGIAGYFLIFKVPFINYNLKKI